MKIKIDVVWTCPNFRLFLVGTMIIEELLGVHFHQK
jgi:hypothetical protein